jgi:hypothetical protein
MEFLISDVLHTAADECLADKESTYWFTEGHRRIKSLEKYSCCAIELALQKLYEKKFGVGCDSYAVTKAEKDVIFEGLRNMGLNTNSINSFPPATGFKLINKKSQQMRYFWLKWAALMAEEQGA